jgi:regulator of replication initiation timing
MLKYLAQNWILLAISASLASAIVVLQTEVNDLQSKLASRDSKADAEVAKFEKDVLARLNAEQIARSDAIAKAQAQQKAAAKAELQRLPSDGFHKTVPFPSASPTPPQ